MSTTPTPVESPVTRYLRGIQGYARWISRGCDPSGPSWWLPLWANAAGSIVWDLPPEVGQLPANERGQNGTTPFLYQNRGIPFALGRILDAGGALRRIRNLQRTRGLTTGDVLEWWDRHLKAVALLPATGWPETKRPPLPRNLSDAQKLRLADWVRKRGGIRRNDAIFKEGAVIREARPSLRSAKGRPSGVLAELACEAGFDAVCDPSGQRADENNLAEALHRDLQGEPVVSTEYDWDLDPAGILEAPRDDWVGWFARWGVPWEPEGYGDPIVEEEIPF